LISDSTLCSSVRERGNGNNVFGGDGGRSSGSSTSLSWLKKTSSVLGTELDRDIAAEAWGGALAIVGRKLFGHFKCTLGTLVFGLKLKHGTIGKETRWVGALLNGATENLSGPAVQEIAVVTVTGGIAVGEHESAGHAHEFVGLPDGLKEQGRDALLVTFGTLATVDEIRVGNMALVVFGIVLTIPA
jgi:hypothetical protein